MAGLGARGRVGQPAVCERGTSVADFFLGSFLGCRVAENPGRRTQQFVQGVASFVNEEALTPEEQGRFSLALVSYIDSNKLDVSTAEFLRDHVAPEHCTAPRRHLEDHGIRADLVFQKDTTLIKYDRLRVQFDSGLTLVGPAEGFDEKVSFHTAEEGPGADVTAGTQSMRGA